MSTAKRIYISLKGQATPQSIAICGNLRQPARTYNTTWYCYNQYCNSKEGRKDKYIYRYLNYIIIGYQFFAFFKVLPVQLEYFVLEHATPNTSLTWVRGNTQGTTFLVIYRSQRINNPFITPHSIYYCDICILHVVKVILTITTLILILY